MIRPGLLSVTFRKLSAARIIELAAEAGLSAIEWGGDVHLPPGDRRKAAELRRSTEAAGLVVSAYGSYYRNAVSDDESFAAVVDTAEALGAPTIRVWAGNRGSADANAVWRAAVRDDLLANCELAAAAGTTISLEFHSHTLADTVDSTLALLEAVDDAALKTFWQPPVGDPAATSLAGLRQLSGYLTNLHCHYYNSAGQQLPLADGAAAWREYLAVAAAVPGDRFASIEFVPGGTVASFLSNAATLKSWTDELAAQG